MISSESDVSERGPGLPVGVEWHVCKYDGNARVHAKENDWLQEPNRPLAGVDGTWVVFSKTRPIRVIVESTEPATPRPGETLLAAARCEVERVLWRLGCFGPVVCAHCGKPAACFGSYEGRPTAYACDACCGHGCEDGHCEPVEVDNARGATPPDPANADLAELLPGLLRTIDFLAKENPGGIAPHTRALRVEAHKDARRACEMLLGELGRLTRSIANDRQSHEGAERLSIAAAGAMDRFRSSVAELEAEVAKERAAFAGANAAWSRAVVLQEQAQDERAAAIARANEAERKLSAVADLQRSTAADLDAARAQLRLVSAGPADVWRWQGDGHDDPASLACPVVMSPSTLREFVAARERASGLEATNERLRKRASEHLDAAGLRTLYDALEDNNMHAEAALVQRLANGVAAHSRWFAIPERQRLDRIGQIVDQLADVRHELDDDDIEAAEALIDLAKGEPTPIARAVAEALGIAPVDVREGPFGTTVDALNAITDLAMKSGNADGSPCPERSWLRRIVKVGLLALASDAEPATKEPG